MASRIQQAREERPPARTRAHDLLSVLQGTRALDQTGGPWRQPVPAHNRLGDTDGENIFSGLRRSGLLWSRSDIISAHLCPEGYGEVCNQEDINSNYELDQTGKGKSLLPLNLISYLPTFFNGSALRLMGMTELFTNYFLISSLPVLPCYLT